MALWEYSWFYHMMNDSLSVVGDGDLDMLVMEFEMEGC